MGIDDITRERPAYQQAVSQREQEERTNVDAGTVTVNLGPLVNAEKTDIEFWLMVTQTVLLAYIALKV